jgi:formate dehydrogenase subunit delta
MDIHRLVTMANEIAAFFAAEPDKAEAARLTASHISRFWERRMRREIVTYHAAGGAGLNDVARAAVGLISQSDTERSPNGPNVPNDSSHRFP